MSVPINTTNVVIVPFPPSISVDEIIQMHLKNGIKNINETMNAFMIYQIVKDYYKQISKEIKKRFKEIAPTPYFINKFETSNQVDTNNVQVDTNNVSLETNLLIYQKQNSLGPTYYNYLPLNSSDTIYSSNPNATNSNLPVDQYTLEITLPDPSNMVQISLGIGYYNSPFINVLGPNYVVNSPPSNSLSPIYSS
ncbi:10520_t:CDS:2 [Diversispora eburnea]|uniref:10520_t:CDS:1 n=1 Tax=Diversispora eburnea TaxID=1213867 RepID=A0A9N9D641_9GLOM|nr:10520_t:CDS:2 [Diversispora eburnea]